MRLDPGFTEFSASRTGRSHGDDEPTRPRSRHERRGAGRVGTALADENRRRLLPTLLEAPAHPSALAESPGPLMTVAAVANGEAAPSPPRFSTAEALEEYAVARARHGSRALPDLVPATATVRRGDAEQEIAPGELRGGDILPVRPSERIATDGMVAAGPDGEPPADSWQQGDPRRSAGLDVLEELPVGAGDPVGQPSLRPDHRSLRVDQDAAGSPFRVLPAVDVPPFEGTDLRARQ
ncbi:hypothetical protein CQR58_003420 [Streptomyces acidiscabies]|uniref:P-type ATPase n=1 Tax=Streptomyces acidiscabies TaxID=42234 RepID=UPI0034C67FD1